MSDLNLNSKRASGLATALNRTDGATIPYMRVPTKRTINHSEDWITINPDRAVTSHLNAQEVTFTLPKAGICGDALLQFVFTPNAATGSGGATLYDAAHGGIFFLQSNAMLAQFDRVEVRHNNRVIQTIHSSWVKGFVKKMGRDSRQAWEAMLSGNRIGTKAANLDTAVYNAAPFAPCLQYTSDMAVNADERTIFSMPLITFFNHTTAHYINNNTTKGVITIHVFTKPLSESICPNNYATGTNTSATPNRGVGPDGLQQNNSDSPAAPFELQPGWGSQNVMEPKLKVKFHNVEDYVMQAVQAQSEEAYDCVTYDTQCQGSNDGIELTAGRNHKIRLTGIQGCARDLTFYCQYKSDQAVYGADKNPERFVEIYRARVTLGGKPICDWRYAHELLVVDKYYDNDIGNIAAVGNVTSTSLEHVYCIKWGFDNSLHSASDCLALGPQTADPILEIETYADATTYSGASHSQMGVTGSTVAAGTTDTGNAGLILFVNANVYNVVYEKAGEYSARTEE